MTNPSIVDSLIVNILRSPSETWYLCERMGNYHQRESMTVQKVAFFQTKKKFSFLKNNILWVAKVQTKERCFDIKKLGAVGEGLIHNCLLYGTDVHKELAKKLIRAYPLAVNDYYIGEDYYGIFVCI